MDSVITKYLQGKNLGGVRKGEVQSTRAGRGGERSCRAGGGWASDRVDAGEGAAKAARDVRSKAWVGWALKLPGRMAWDRAGG